MMDRHAVGNHGASAPWNAELSGTTMTAMKSTTKTEETSGQTNETIEQGKALYNRALEKTREGAKAADEIVHRHAYNVLAAGVVAGFLTGFLVCRGSRCCAG